MKLRYKVSIKSNWRYKLWNSDTIWISTLKTSEECLSLCQWNDFVLVKFVYLSVYWARGTEIIIEIMGQQFVNMWSTATKQAVKLPEYVLRYKWINMSQINRKQRHFLQKYLLFWWAKPGGNVTSDVWFYSS